MDVSLPIRLSCTPVLQYMWPVMINAAALTAPNPALRPHHPSRTGMNNSCLPIDICEQIIDTCRGSGFPWWREDSYETWCRSALVCYAWRPRSQYNLLREVVFERASQVALLIRTLLDRPHLAKLVRTIGVSPLHANPVPAQYIPFAQTPLPQLLENCATLHQIGRAHV